MSTTYANVTIQDLKFTEKSLGLNVKITYVSDRVGAGASIETREKGEHVIEVHMDPALTTAAEIKAAVEAHPQANSWVAVTVTGSASNVQVSVVEAALAGGAAVATASASFGPILYTALASGTAGNSVRIEYVNDAAVDVAVSGNDITVSFIDGVSTASEVAAAVNADVEANLLVMAKSDDHIPMLVVHCASLTALSGGAAAVAPSVELQDLTFASDTTGTSDNGSTISYTTGATAGSEVVSVSSQDISVQIENGVSTATQIKAAFDASTVANGTKASGTATVVSYAALAPVAAVAATGSITCGVPVASAAEAPAVAATKTFDSIVYTANDAGTSGNSITVEYDNDLAGSGDVAVVEVIGTAILVHMDDAGVAAIAATGSYTFPNGYSFAAGNTATVNGVALVEGADWDAETSDEVTAQNLAAAITTETATTLCTAVAVGAVVQITANTPGAAGNSITLASSENNTLPSDSTLGGGVDATPGTSGNTIKTAVNADSEANLLVTVTGASSDVQAAMAATPLEDGAEIVPEVVGTTVTVNGTTFTYVAAAPGAGEFSTIGELEALVEAVTGVNSSENGTVVAITAAVAGVAGNAITLARAGTGTLAVSGATLTGGAEAIAGKSVTVAGHALVAGTDFQAETDNDTTAENLKDAIHALTEVNATRTDNIVTVEAANIGVAGNTITLATTGGAALTLSGATLSGGLDGWECTISGTGSTAQVTVNEAATSGAMAPSGTSFLMTDTERTIKENYFVYQFGFIPSRLRIKNTDSSGANILVISYDGVNPAVALAAGQELLLDSAGISIPHAVALKYTTGAPAYVIEASAIGPNLSDPTAPEED